MDAEELAGALEATAYDALEDVGGGFHRDVLTMAVGRIDFAEIAASLKE